MKKHMRLITIKPAIAQDDTSLIAAIFEAKQDLFLFFIDLFNSMMRSGPWGIVFPPATSR